ncbi:MAG: glycosyl transferase family 2 [Clostridia bacterium]|nr:glycosyl transferase family 2 [Clostridia bacterium]
MKKKLRSLLEGKTENHILPFFWQHGEDDETLLTELHKIYDSGIRAICVESRPAEEFAQAGWFEDMHLLISECERLGMEFWLLDDKHFPTGIAAGALEREHPELGKHALTERHTDVAGPMKDCAVIVEGWLGQESELVGVIACERCPGDQKQRMTGRALNLTAQVRDGMVFFDVPEGYWRIFTLIDTPNKDRYVDTLRKDSVKVLIDAVYEPHYRELGKYFGKTFRGYFSDEPFIMRNALLPIGDANRSKGIFAWNDNVRAGLEEKLGEDWLLKLPSLWFPGDHAAETRIAYMDVVTNLYRECFSYQLGDWCRAHGVEYIGHIVEDDGSHCRTANAAGHFFRSLDGQDMAGIDVVLCQIVPGMTDNTIAVPCSYDISDHEFFHFGLAKLGSSHAHIQPQKRGRAMCEIYGAYGWAEGLPMMKWLTDHMLVRGINEFVPHAFTPKYPDYDCPPHFYAHGHNPEYRGFGRVMDYVNRVSTILSDGRHFASAAILYHAEAEWSGGKYMKFEKPAKILMQAQIDFDIIPEDYLAKAEVRDGKICLGKETYPVLIVPYTEILPDAILNDIRRMRDAGVQVYFIDDLPDRTAAGKSVQDFDVCALESLVETMKPYRDLTAEGTAVRDLRFFHYEKDGTEVYFLTNEGITETVSVELTIAGHEKKKYIQYDPMENKAFRVEGGDTIALTLEPYQSVMLFFGADCLWEELPEQKTLCTDDRAVVPQTWQIAFAEPEAYDPADRNPENGFGETAQIKELYNIVRENPRFAGFVRYETEAELTEGLCVMDLGKVGECAALWVNGEYVDEKIIPPYRFTFNAKAGVYKITVVTTSHLGYHMRDGFSRFLMMEPVGLIGPVEIRSAEER